MLYPSAEESELDDEQPRQHIKAGIQLTPAAGQQLDEGPGNETQGDAVDNGEGQRHDEGGDYHRGGFGQVFPVDLYQAAGHQYGNEEQRRRGSKRRDGPCQRGKEQAQQKQRSNHARGQAGTAARGGASGGFHITGGGRGTQQRAGHGGGAVSHQGAAQARQLAILFHQPGLLRDADQGAGGVEQIDEQEGKDHADQANFQGAREIQLQQGRGQAGRGGNKAVSAGQAQRQADKGNDQDADHYRTGNLAIGQGDDDGKTQGRQQRAGLGHITEADQGGGVIHHDTGALQVNQRQEQADAGGDGRAQGQTSAVDQTFADLEDAQYEEQEAADEHGTQGHRPAVAHGTDHGIGEEGVQPHAGRQGERVVGPEAHDQRA